jgi:succinyl-CoA synthetase alpha subunit
MSILVNRNTRVMTQGITGKTGQFHTRMGKEYANGRSCYVAGVNPKKPGESFEGIPIFATVKEAKEKTGAMVSVIYVPPPFAADAILEAHDAGVGVIVAITEGIPAHDMLRVYNAIKDSPTRLVGPNCPGVLSPEKANVGIIPAQFFSPGSVGLLSRSGTLTYQIGNELSRAGVGNSTIVGIGGDPIIGSDFIDVIGMFEADEETELIVMVGEIGGDAEERAAEFIAAEVSKPVVAYIAGFTAPPGKQMGHAGAIISGSSGTAEAKAEALEAKGVRVGRNPSEAAKLAAETVGAAA